MHHPTDRIIHTTAFVTTVVEHWLEREYKKEGPGRKENVLFNTINICYLCYVTSGIWLRITQIIREETCCYHFMGYSFQIGACDLLYVSFHKGVKAYHGLSYISCRALAGMRNCSMFPP